MHGQNTVYPKSGVKLAHAYTADTRLSASSPRLSSLGTRLLANLIDKKIPHYK